MRILSILLAATALLCAPPAWSYGRYGHASVAEIAMRNVRPETARSVRALVRRSAALETPECPADTLAALSVWADCIRGQGLRFNYTSPWHYQNVDICRPFDLGSACRDGNCVSAQVERNARLLAMRELPLRERVQALAFLVHFVADLHMPLHAGDRGDRGGNDVAAAYGDYAGERLNLHSIWDTALAERALTTPPSLVRRYSPEERARISAGDVTEWSREAWAVSRDVAYPSAIGGDGCGPKPNGRIRLENATIEGLVEHARQQVERAGLRLARLLDEAFA